MRVFERGAAILALAGLILPTIGSASANELLVMPYACAVISGQPVLTPGAEQSHRIIGPRDQRKFTACSPVNPSMCRHWNVHRFDLDCDGKRVSWVSVVAATSEGNRRAWLLDGRMLLRMGPGWSLAPDDPCSREAGPDERSPLSGRMRRQCAERLATAPPPVVEMPFGYAPMLGIDGIFVAAAAPPASSASNTPSKLPPIVAGGQPALPTPKSAIGDAKPQGHDLPAMLWPDPPGELETGPEIKDAQIAPPPVAPPPTVVAPGPQAAPKVAATPASAPVAEGPPKQAEPKPAPKIAVATPPAVPAPGSAPAPAPAPSGPAKETAAPVSQGPRVVTPPSAAEPALPSLPPAKVAAPLAPATSEVQKKAPAADAKPSVASAAPSATPEVIPPVPRPAERPVASAKPADSEDSSPSLLNLFRATTTGAIVAFAGLAFGLLAAFALARRREQAEDVGRRRRDVSAMSFEGKQTRGSGRPGRNPPPGTASPPRSPAKTLALGRGTAASEVAEWDDRMPRTREEALEVLGIGIAPSATGTAIKKIVDGLRMSWHPDLAKDETDRALREIRSKQINVAWDILQAQRAEV